MASDNPFKQKRGTEYWIELVDNDSGDIEDHVWQTPSKKEAIARAREEAKIAKASQHVEIEKVTYYGSEAEGIVDQEFELIEGWEE